MDGEENLFGPGSVVKSGEKSDLFDIDDTSVQASNPDDFFAALASDRSGSKEEQFDPFGDLWGDVGSGNSMQQPATSTVTTTTTKSAEMTDTPNKIVNSSSSDAFGDLLDFDPLGSVPVSSSSKTSEPIKAQDPGKEAASLFDDLDPLFKDLSTPASNGNISTNPFKTDVSEDLFSPRQSTVSKDVEDLFGSSSKMKTDNIFPAQTKSENFTDDDLFGFGLSSEIEEPTKRDDKTDIFESMKASSFDPFASDPFIVEKTESTVKEEALERGLSSEHMPDILDPLRDTKADGVKAGGVDSEEKSLEIVTTMIHDEPMSITVTDAVSMEDEDQIVMRRPKPTEDLLETGDQTIDGTMDLSAIEDTEHLDIDATKHKGSLRKKGSLALRRKPSRKGVRTSLLAAMDKYQDSTEPKPAPDTGEEEINGLGNDDVHEKHDEERPENPDKPSPPQRPSVLPRHGVAGRTPPRGQILLPGIGEINKVKLRSSPVKPPSSTVSPEASKASDVHLTPQLRTPQQRIMQTSPSQPRTSLFQTSSSQSRTTPSQTRASMHGMGSPSLKPSLRPKPSLVEKPKFDRKTTDPSSKEDHSEQPSWLKEPKQAKLRSATDGLSTKLQQEQEPEKPAWMKAATEKRKRASELLEKDSPNNNKENSSPAPWMAEYKTRRSPLSPETKDQSETRLNRLNDFHTQKSSTSRHDSDSSTENVIQNNLTKTPRDRTSSDISQEKSQDLFKDSLSLKLDSNGHSSEGLFSGSPPRGDVKDDVVSRRPKVTDKSEYVPSWSSPRATDNKEKVLGGNISPRDESQTTVNFDVPKWKRDLLEKKRQKRESDIYSSPQTPSAKEESGSDASTPSWQRELQKRRRSSIKKEPAVTEPQQSTQPEWMRKAAERQARFAKSGLPAKK